jgi:acetyl esterase/lipase
MHIRIILLLLLAFSPLFAAENPRPKAPPLVIPEGVTATKNIPYVPGGKYRQQLDIYKPTQAGKPLPLVVWIHGGGWRQGNKEGCPALYLATNGFVVASLNYRLSQEAKFPAQIQDCKAAIRWLRAHAAEYQIDPNRIGVWGASAGGHLVALLGTTGNSKLWDVGENLAFSSAVQAVCDSCGPTDFLRFSPTSNVASPNTNSPITQLLGGPMSELKNLAKAASPMTYISKAMAPMFIIHGDADQVVPLEQSQILDEAARNAGVESTLYVGKGGGHVFELATRETQELTLNFFKKHLQANTSAVSSDRAAK